MALSPAARFLGPVNAYLEALAKRGIEAQEEKRRRERELEEIRLRGELEAKQQAEQDKAATERARITAEAAEERRARSSADVMKRLERSIEAENARAVATQGAITGRQSATQIAERAERYATTAATLTNAWEKQSRTDAEIKEMTLKHPLIQDAMRQFAGQDPEAAIAPLYTKVYAALRKAFRQPPTRQDRMKYYNEQREWLEGIFTGSPGASFKTTSPEDVDTTVEDMAQNLYDEGIRNPEEAREAIIASAKERGLVFPPDVVEEVVQALAVLMAGQENLAVPGR